MARAPGLSVAKAQEGKTCRWSGGRTCSLTLWLWEVVMPGAKLHSRRRVWGSQLRYNVTHRQNRPDAVQSGNWWGWERATDPRGGRAWWRTGRQRGSVFPSDQDAEYF